MWIKTMDIIVNSALNKAYNSSYRIMSYRIVSCYMILYCRTERLHRKGHGLLRAEDRQGRLGERGAVPGYVYVFIYIYIYMLYIYITYIYIERYKHT